MDGKQQDLVQKGSKIVLGPMLPFKIQAFLVEIYNAKNIFREIYLSVITTQKHNEKAR